MARNVVHGLYIDKTRLRTSFVPPVQGHIIRDWVAKHPRIVIPVIVFLLGTLTYTVRGISWQMFSLPTFAQIFDPVRALMVEGKVLDWFSYRGSFRHLNCSCIQLNLYAESHLYQWLRRNTIDRLTIKPADTLDVDAEATWQERQEAETALRNYLDDLPCVSFLERWISVSFHIRSEHRISSWAPG